VIPKPLGHEPLKGSIHNLKKDLTLALETASTAGVAMPMTSLATPFLQSAISLELTSVGIVKIFERLS
jgi:3-hydroxyisobutyrate dehydrogenase-like beta-hydroxyacid dehydrogenase